MEEVEVEEPEVEVEEPEVEVEEEEETTEDQPAPKKRIIKKSSKKPQFIDGQQLSKKEIEFQEFSNKKFNTEEWLKKNGLIF